MDDDDDDDALAAPALFFFRDLWALVVGLVSSQSDVSEKTQPADQPASQQERAGSVNERCPSACVSREKKKKEKKKKKEESLPACLPTFGRLAWQQSLSLHSLLELGHFLGQFLCSLGPLLVVVAVFIVVLEIHLSRLSISE